MNIQENDILCFLLNEKYSNQRRVAEATGHSLGSVNRSIKDLQKEGYLGESMNLTNKALMEFKNKSPRRAIILAAGFGMRMVPINTEVPKGLLEINGEPLIERIIRQLQEVNINEIYIVVGFLKERYEYLIDTFNVELIYNSEYANRNNLHSLCKVKDKLSNSYIIPCDIWCSVNPFHTCELYSWYMVNDVVSNQGDVQVNRKMEIVRKPSKTKGNKMIGICYLTPEDANMISNQITKLENDEGYDNAFWEEALYCKNRMNILARVVHAGDFVEINTYEQLRELDCNSNQLKTDAMQVICKTLNTSVDKITNITVLKKGMTNRSFLFECKNKKYIMRIPGEGTDKLVDRYQETNVYHAIADWQISDNINYINPDNGYKISEYIEDAKTCNPFCKDDVSKCMKFLRAFHELGLNVEHTFDIYSKIDFYESLWNGEPSIYKDYKLTKKNIISLRPFIEANIEKKTLTHIDAVPDNFLFYKENGAEKIRLIDWEYAGMQDPHIDIAMFCIYSMYNKTQIDQLIEMYFVEGCEQKIRIKIYCYIAVCGLLWSNWCEYKRLLGVEFGEYSLCQYRYAKEYYKMVQNELKKLEMRNTI